MMPAMGLLPASHDPFPPPAGLAGFALLALLVLRQAAPAADDALAQAAAQAKQALKATQGPAEAARIERGVDQVARYWRAEDGDAAALREFLTSEFIPSGPALDATFARLEFAQERVAGYFTSMVRDLRRGADLEIGPQLAVDRRLGAFDPAAHLSEDLFANKLAFVVLLNFPLTTLRERVDHGLGWSRRQWAETRLAQQFQTRVPASVNEAAARAYAAAETYIAGYNVYMHHVLATDGTRLFPAGMRLISHWNLRDELKAGYADPEGLSKQRLIQKVMERIVRQEIPAAVVGNPLLDWDPAANTVKPSPVEDAEPPAGATADARDAREPDERYRRWLDIFRAERLRDAHSPDHPTLIDRRFTVGREMPEATVRELLESVLASPLGERVGRLIEARLARRLEPFDIWYGDFKPRGRYTEAELDALTRKRYPTAEAYAADIPRLLRDLGFSDERARYLADRIVVEPSRGAGHAFGPARRDDQAHLRTRVGPGGMDYKGYNIAVHEMGHNVEQVFSVTTIDHTLLAGVPNTAFTEALAFVFQARDLELLGLGRPERAADALHALDSFWKAREIAGVALVDMAAWRWLYEHPDATPAQFREAVVAIAADAWNRHYAPIFGARDVPLLAIYSHLVSYGLYTPDYPLGALIAFQVETHFKKTSVPMGVEFERICRLGSITPDAWMRQAVGSKVSAGPLLEAAAKAAEVVASP
jgi:hypothetical protein